MDRKTLSGDADMCGGTRETLQCVLRMSVAVQAATYHHFLRFFLSFISFSFFFFLAGARELRKGFTLASLTLN